jgi:uncharacterized membrane protein YGL010W
MINTIEDRMAGYSAYHRDFRNKITHFFGVPMVYYSPLIALGWIRFDLFGLDLSISWILFALVMIWYFTLDVRLSILMLLISLPIVYLTDIISKMEFQQSLYIFLGIKLFGWVIQLIGHVFEGRRPALVDNLVQALMAPLFLIAEVQFALGMRKELFDAVESRVLKYK